MIGLCFAIAAIICAIVYQKRGSKSGLATAGIITGVIGGVMAIGFLALYIVGYIASKQSTITPPVSQQTPSQETKQLPVGSTLVADEYGIVVSNFKRDTASEDSQQMTMRITMTFKGTATDKTLLPSGYLSMLQCRTSNTNSKLTNYDFVSGDWRSKPTDGDVLVADVACTTDAEGKDPVLAISSYSKTYDQLTLQ